MPSKGEFLHSIREDTVFNEDFCKKVLGYSWYDPDFLDTVQFTCECLYGLPFCNYEEWLAKWEKKDIAEGKKAAAWYAKQVEEQWERKKVAQQNAERRTAQQERYRFKGFPQDW